MDRRHRGESVKDRPESTGLPRPVEDTQGGKRDVPRLPLSAAWIPDDLLQDTCRVFGEAYGRLVTEEEAVEILTNIKRLAHVLIEAKMGGERE